MINIYPLADYWDAEYRALLGYVPNSSFYLKSSGLLPYRYKKTAFILNAAVGIKINVTVRAKSHDTSTRSNAYSFVASSTQQIIHIQLGLGQNEVLADAWRRVGPGLDDWVPTGESFYGVFNTARLATLLSSLGKQLYDNVTLDLTNTRNQILSPFGSKLVEHLIPYQDLLVDVRSLRILSTRMALRASTATPGSQLGVTDWLTALTTNTPIFNPLTNSFTEYDYSQPLVHQNEHFGGQEAHIWLPNPCVTQWATFVRYVNAIDTVYTMTDLSEYVYRGTYNGAQEQHEFPAPVGFECSLTQMLLDLGCLDSMTLLINSAIVTRFLVCVPGYPLDFDVEPCSLLGLRRLDCGNFFDVGERADTYDEFDPLGDGWEGHTLSTRYDSSDPGGVCVDTMIRYVDLPEKSKCCYTWGAATTFLGANWTEVSAPNDPLIWSYIVQFAHVPTYASVAQAEMVMAPLSNGDVCVVGNQLMYWRANIVPVPGSGMFLPIVFWDGMFATTAYHGGFSPATPENPLWANTPLTAFQSFVNNIPTEETIIFDFDPAAAMGVFHAPPPLWDPTKRKLVYINTQIAGAGSSNSTLMDLTDGLNSWMYTFSQGGVSGRVASMAFPAFYDLPLGWTEVLLILDPVVGDYMYTYQDMQLRWHNPPPGGGGVDTFTMTCDIPDTVLWGIQGYPALLLLEEV